jgi:hypothetical protein
MAINMNFPRHQELMAAAWPVALRLKTFGYKEIASETGANMHLVAAIVKLWVDQGKARQTVVARAGDKNRNLYEATPSPEDIPSAGGDAYDQMWQVMRKFRAFSPTDLQAYCAVAVDLKLATAYCQTLMVAGYLRVVHKAVPPHKQATYRLIKATGPNAPRTRNIRCLIDTNSGQILPLVGGAA